ncbi:MAG: NAD-dependent epimerase/dehydratase family protein [Rhodospirillales bacterium]|nr:NAD-dependent epimerase/dehydratase family protein [Rhodospirillales bacterium]
MKKIIVAGGAGFIGSHLVDRLLTRQDIETLVVVDNLWTGEISNLAHIRDQRLKIEIHDIETFQTDVKFDEVYHLASPAAPQIYSSEPVRTIAANVLGAMRLREIMKDGGTFCYVSTSEVYGDPLVSPQPEDYRGSVDCTGPRSSYDEGKRCTEAFLFECHRVYGMKIKVIRPFNVYGPRTKPDDGRAVSNFVTQALTGKPITVYGSGNQSRSWGYISDIIEGMKRYFWRDGIDFCGPLNIGNNREIPVLKVAEYVAALVPGSEIIFLPPPPQDPTNRCPDLTLGQRILPGWTCGIPYEEGIKLTMKWFAESIDIQNSNEALFTHLRENGLLAQSAV